DCEARPGQQFAEPAGLLAAVNGATAAANDRDRDGIGWPQLAADIEHDRGIGNLLQPGWVCLIFATDNPHAVASAPIDLSFAIDAGLRAGDAIRPIATDALHLLDARGRRAKCCFGAAKILHKPAEKNWTYSAGQGPAQIDAAGGRNHRAIRAGAWLQRRTVA